MKQKKLNIDKVFERLQKLYSKIPGTEGCMEHINKPKEEGGCEGWCCLHQNPQVLQVEFLNTWGRICKEWAVDDIANLVEGCLRAYVSEVPTKGCVFFDKESKLCRQHKTRPYNCRIYGIIPEEEFKPRYDRLKVLYQNEPLAVIKEQCDLVSVKGNSRRPTVDDTANWWLSLTKIEESIGVPRKRMNDEQGGTYRTYHDHILLHLFEIDILEQFQNLRLHGNHMEKETTIKTFMEIARKNLVDIFSKK
tara:strand:- start:1473 stop:2219 length:747 start_codon:yes stop_codon:yes gene_type:complete